MTVAAADFHVPSNAYGAQNQYVLSNTVVVVVRGKPEEREADQKYANHLYGRFNVGAFGISEFLICAEATEAAIVSSFRQIIRTRFFNMEPSV